MQLETLKLSNQNSNNIGERVYNTLRGNIILLRFKPGEPLNVKDISSQLEVSRSPVRDAIIKLEKEGLVEIIPQKGTSVSRIDVKRVEEERFLRESLEDKVLKLFIEYYSELDILELKRIIAIQKQCLQEKEFKEFLDHDEEFHGVFFRVAQKNLCWELVRSMSGHYRRVRLMTLWDRDIVKNAIAQHEEMLHCIEEKKIDTLMKILEDHTRKINIEEIELFKTYPDYFQDK